MTRSLKVPIINFAVAVAVSVAGISTAMATDHHFTGDTGDKLSSEALNEQVFEMTTGTGEGYKCKKAGIEKGEVTEDTAQSISFRPSYEECKAFKPGSEPVAKVTQNECEFKFAGTTTEGNPTNAQEHANVDIVCPEGKSIVLDVTALNLNCSTIYPQEVKHSVRYENVGQHVRIKATAHGILSKTVGVCAEAPETHTNGSFTGEITLSAPNGVSVGGPPALNHHFTGDTGDKLSSEALNEQVFEMTTGTGEGYKCKKAGIEKGEVTEDTAQSISFRPSYEECKAFKPGSEPVAKVTQNECEFKFAGTTTEGNPTNAQEHANVDIVCPEGKSIVLDVTALNLNCSTIYPQEVKHSVRYENVGQHVRIKATAHGILSKTVGVCAEAPETHTNGSFTGEITLSAPNGVSVGGPPALNHHFTGDTGDKLSSEALNEQVFEMTTGTGEGYKCKKAGIEKGEVTEDTAQSISFRPSYEECKAFKPGSEPVAKVTQNECEFKFAGTTTEGNPTNAQEHANVDIVCPEGKSIVLDVTALNLNCSTIYPQEVKHSVRYENVGQHVRIKATAHGILSKTVGVCAEAPETHTNGSFTGEITLSAPNGVSVSQT